MYATIVTRFGIIDDNKKGCHRIRYSHNGKKYDHEFGWKRDPVGAKAKAEAMQKQLTEQYITGKNSWAQDLAQAMLRQEGDASLEGASKGISHFEFGVSSETSELLSEKLKKVGFHAYRDVFKDADGNLFHFNLDGKVNY